MSTGTKAIMRTTHFGLILVAMATTSCLEIDPPNTPPTASVQVLLNGMAVPVAVITGVAAPAYMIMGAGQTVTLQGAGNDPDGTINSYEWFRTDVSRTMRMPTIAQPAGAGGAGAGGAGAGGAGAGGAGAGGAGAGGMGGMGGMPAAGAGGMAGVPAPPFTGDPPAMATVSVMLPVAGNYRFSLWVTDNGGLVSAPASVTLVVR